MKELFVVRCPLFVFSVWLLLGLVIRPFTVAGEGTVDRHAFKHPGSV